MTIEQLTKKLDDQITLAYAEYTDLHEELNKHRGKPIDDTNLPEVNRLLKAIQDKFVEIYPAFHFIAFKHPMAVNSTNAHNDFIETLKKAGAAQIKDEKEK